MGIVIYLYDKPSGSYLIQIPRLKPQTKTKLERVLQIFSPEYRTEDRHKLDFKGDANDLLVKKIVDRLSRAIASDEIREKMDVEDEIDRIFEREIKKAEAAKDKIEIRNADFKLLDNFFLKTINEHANN